LVQADAIQKRRQLKFVGKKLTAFIFHPSAAIFGQAMAALYAVSYVPSRGTGNYKTKTWYYHTYEEAAAMAKTIQAAAISIPRKQD
jgi:hypothetical protein